MNDTILAALAAQADIALDPLAGCLGEANAAAFRKVQADVLAFGTGGMIVDADGNAQAVDPADLCPPAPIARAHVSPPLGLESTQAGLFAPEAPAASVNVCILALDLGTKTGYAVRKRDGKVVHGTEDFTPRTSWAPGQKWQRFRSWLSATITAHNVTQIAFEDVKRHGPGQVLAAHAYGGFRAMLEMVADQHRVTLVPFGVGQIKKHWTGSGVAKKDEMVMQAKVRGFRSMDDNNADALALLHLAVAREKGEWAAPASKPKAKRKAGTVAQERAA
ncbi:hypothetical protein AXY46_03105 [Achromobacter xylosoxidans]|nr:hypothetical protein AXY46_03105 [Achromobacter xylosoxidans]